MTKELINQEPNSTLGVDGTFKYEHIRNGKVIDSWKEPNIVVDQGLIYMLNTGIGNVSQNSNWYIGLFQNNYTPLASDTAAIFPGAGAGNEATIEYDEATRPVFTPVATNAKVITNTSAAYTFNAATSIYGAFMISDSTKGGVSGTLLSASKFGAVRQMQALDVLNVTYELTIADV